MERVCIFIDGSNFYHSLKGECEKTNLDFSKLVKWLIGDRQLVRTYYYNASVNADIDPERASSQQKFFDILKRIPYFEIRLGRLEARGNTFIEKGVDIALAIDMLSMAVKGVYDTAILVSCDGDFVHAVNAVKDIGRHVEVACFRKAYHMMQCADKVIKLNTSSLKDFWLKS